jgi:hypothetical protein
MAAWEKECKEGEAGTERRKLGRERGREGGREGGRGTLVCVLHERIELND